MKLSISIYVNLVHLCRESEFGSNSLVCTWKSTKLYLHRWAVEIVSAHRVQSERWTTQLHGGVAVTLAVLDMSRNWYSVYCHGTYATLQKTLHNITGTWSRQQWNGFYETIAFEEENKDPHGLVISQTFPCHSSSLHPSLLPSWAAKVKSEKIRKSDYCAAWMMWC